MGRLFVLLIVLYSCDCSSTGHGPCDVEPVPATCGQSCNTTPCPTGFFCAEARCTAECSAAIACPSGRRCTADGRCQMTATPDANLNDGPTTDGNACADVTIETRRQTPTVIVIVDQSGSMTAAFGNGNRWDVLRDSLIAQPDGLITSLQSQVRFGLALYSARSGGTATPIGMCPIVTTVDPALNNVEAIRAVYGPAQTMEDTPTGDSVDAVVRWLEASGGLNRSDGDTVFVLATDGDPDRCEELNPSRGQAESVAAVQAAYQRGIRTYVISVGSEVSRNHLQDVANAGVGRASGAAAAPFWVAGDDDGLRQALNTIVGGALSCVVELNGRIDNTAACSGTVELNGSALQCGGPSGWRAVDETHIELLGDACRTFQMGTGNTLRAVFPCSAILI